MTNRHLQIRACKHTGVSALTGAVIKTAFSSVQDHLLKSGHDSNIDDFRTLYKSHDQTTLPIWEHIYNKKLRPNLNIQNDAVIFDLIC